MNWNKDEFTKIYNRSLYSNDERELHKFIDDALHHNTEDIIDVISGKIRQYKEYYNPIGDARNQGKHALADDLLKELQSLKPTHKE